jgi:hypothetical protein
MTGARPTCEFTRRPVTATVPSARVGSAVCGLCPVRPNVRYPGGSAVGGAGYRLDVPEQIVLVLPARDLTSAELVRELGLGVSCLLLGPGAQCAGEAVALLAGYALRQSYAVTRAGLEAAFEDPGEDLVSVVWPVRCVRPLSIVVRPRGKQEARPAGSPVRGNPDRVERVSD